MDEAFLEFDQDVTPKGCHRVTRFATFAHNPGTGNAASACRFTHQEGIELQHPENDDQKSMRDGNRKPGDERLATLTAWVRGLPDMAGASLETASDDASFRRYFRVRHEASTWIAMDAPPPMEDCRPFVQVAAWLQAMSLNGPEILAEDLERGFLLMADLGDDTYLDVLNAAPSRTRQLYDDAVDALLTMQRRGEAYRRALPPYDGALLRRELALFSDWLCKRHLGIDFTDTEASDWRRTCDLLVENALMQPRVFVHRDYHSRNLMVTPDNNPGIIDFQDAVNGPLTYDLASLLKDCYIDLGAPEIERCILRFQAGLDATIRDSVDDADFRRFFDLTGVQRHLKAAGIFARLLHRDGKARYMADVPRTLDYIVAVLPHYPELEGLGTLIETRVLPKLARLP